MLVVLLFIAGLATFSNADFTPDFNCTEVNAAAKTVLTAASTICDDKYSADTCATLFGTAAKAGDEKRDPKCNMATSGGSSVYNEDLKQVAVASCPKHCGYCCQTPEYDCANKQFPRTNCDTVKPDQCKDPKWRQILAEDCPHSCGLCLESSGCMDAVIECKNDLSICRNIDMQPFVKVNCQKTCGYCDSAVTTYPGSGVTTFPCPNIDKSTQCAKWAKNGFCTNNFYSKEERIAQCGKSCSFLCQ